MAKSGVPKKQLKKQQETTKQNEKIKGLNAKLAEVRDLEKAGNYDQAIAILQEVSQRPIRPRTCCGPISETRIAGPRSILRRSTPTRRPSPSSPISGAYHSGLADAYAKSGQTDKAVAEYTAAAQVDPANAASYYFNEGAVFTNTGKVDDAITAFDKAIQLDPNRAEAYYYKGINMMGKATTGKDGKFVAPPGTAECFPEVPGAEARRPDGPTCERHAGQHWRFGGNHLRQAEDARPRRRSRTKAYSNLKGGRVPPFFLAS